jgi:hypothetical protein
MNIDIFLEFELFTLYIDTNSLDFVFGLVGKGEYWLFYISVCEFWGWTLNLQLFFLEKWSARLTNA